MQVHEPEYSKNINLSVWIKLFQYARSQWKRIAGVLFFMTILALTDVLMPLVTRYALDHLAGNPDKSLVHFALVYALIIAVQVLSIFLFILTAGRIENNSAAEMRNKAFRKLQTLSFSYYDKTPVGSLINYVGQDIGTIAEIFGWGLVDLTWALVYLIASILSMLALSLPLALGVIVVFPPLILISFYFEKRILHLQRGVRKQNSHITAMINEGIMGLKTTKTLVREEENMKEFSVETGLLRQMSVRSATLSALFLPLVISLSSLATGYALGLGSTLILKGALSLGTLAAFVSYTIQMYDPVRNIAASLSEMKRIQAAAERLISLMETPQEVCDRPEAIAIDGDFLNPKPENWGPILGEIRFEEVCFAYKDGENVLDHFSFHAKPGEIIALVGETGAGKSTIVNLLCRFYEPTSGRILIDGQDIREHSQLWLQSQLGYVLQDPHLFSGSILDNIRYAKPDASPEAVKQAAKLACADRFIDKLPQAYQSQVGEGGNRLSTGEKQLISFARAILNDPRLFILDEASSSIDTHTEVLIQQAIEQTLAGRTSFIIAHRLSTIRRADRILVIEDGKILESGSHEALMKLKGRYYELYINQYRDELSEKIYSAKA